MPTGVYIRTQFHKKRISDAISGVNHPFYGKHHSVASRLLISQKKMGMRHPNSLKNLTHRFKKGYKPSETHIRLLSESHMGQKAWNKGMKMGKEWEERCRKQWLGKPQFRSEEGKKSFHKKMSGKNNPNWIEDRTKLVGRHNRKLLNTEYKQWRIRVRNRDNLKCKLINENCSGRLEVHHILSWKDYPELRYDINNGITLCHAHHPRKRAKEKELAPIFQGLVSASNELSSPF